MTEQRFTDPLSRVLRENDPLAHDSGLGSEERAAMRREILNAVPETRFGRWQIWSPTLSVVALLALALATAWWPRPVDNHRGERRPAGQITGGTPSPSRVSAESVGDAVGSLEIQFETPGGTLVVWVLDPKFPS